MGDAYIDALCTEISSKSEGILPQATLYIGGGTPSLLNSNQLQKLLNTLHKTGRYSEISMECNPGTVGVDKLKLLLELGVNRLSFGVQTFSDNLLQALGRIHTAQQALQTIDNAQKVGFNNISIDLMYALPQQTLQTLENDLQQALQLGVQHLSCYALKVEQGTPLERSVANGNITLPSEELQDTMYDFVPQYLHQHLERYEISNYAQRGRECHHNQVYWQYLPYQACGVSACAFDGNYRYTNTHSIEEYITAHRHRQPWPREAEYLPTSTQQIEYIFMNMRTAQGVCPQTFATRFGLELLPTYQVFFDKFILQGAIQILHNGNYALTALGMKYSNTIFSELL